MSTGDFNPYHQWLGLDPQLSQPNYYELLGIDEKEADAEKIAAAADIALSRVRSYRPGDRAPQWARLLDEIAAAKKCLHDAQQRTEYDRRLQERRVAGPPVSRRPAPRSKSAAPEVPVGEARPAAPGTVPMSAPGTVPMPPRGPLPMSLPAAPGPYSAAAANAPAIGSGYGGERCPGLSLPYRQPCWAYPAPNLTKCPRRPMVRRTPTGPPPSPDSRRRPLPARCRRVMPLRCRRVLRRSRLRDLPTPMRHRYPNRRLTLREPCCPPA